MPSCQVALKQLRFKLRPEDLDKVMFEVAAGFRLRHPNIAQVFGLAHLDNNQLGIVMEYADQGPML